MKKMKLSMVNVVIIMFNLNEYFQPDYKVSFLRENDNKPYKKIFKFSLVIDISFLTLI